MEYVMCNNCQGSILQQNFTIHQLYCNRSMSKCDVCYQSYDTNDQWNHDLFHEQNTCKDCLEFQIDIKNHNCSQQFVSCDFCQLKIKISKLSLHKVQCLQSSQICQYCSQEVKNKDIALHQPLCKKLHTKELQCLTCKLAFKSEHEYQSHQKLNCDIYTKCKFCELTMHPTEIHQHTLYCGSKTIECSFCKKNILTKQLAEHELKCFQNATFIEKKPIQEITPIDTLQVNYEPDDDYYNEYLEQLQCQYEF